MFLTPTIWNQFSYKFFLIYLKYLVNSIQNTLMRFIISIETILSYSIPTMRHTIKR